MQRTLASGGVAVAQRGEFEARGSQADDGIFESSNRRLMGQGTTSLEANPVAHTNPFVRQGETNRTQRDVLFQFSKTMTQKKYVEGLKRGAFDSAINH